MADREPNARFGRPTDDMTQPSHRAEHAAHDLHLIAAAADRDVDERTRLDADRQAADCSECASLLSDLRALDTALAALPRSIPVTRDFRLSAEQAARLGRGRGWRRLLRPFAPAASPSLRSLGNAFAALGLAGLLFTTVLPGLGPQAASLAGPAAAPSDQRTSEQSTKGGGSPVPAAAPSAAPAYVTNSGSSGAGGSETAPGDRGPVSQPGPTSGDAAFGGGVTPTDGRDLGSGGALTPTQSPSPLMYATLLSATLFLVGVALWLLRRLAARLA